MLRYLLERSGIPALPGDAEAGCVSLKVAHAQLEEALVLIHDAVMEAQE